MRFRFIEEHRETFEVGVLCRALEVSRSGYYAYKAITGSGGWGEDVTDPELVEGIKLLAETEGIFTETAGGVTVAVTQKLIEQGRIARDECIVISVTGNGLKTQEAVMDHVERPQLIEPNVGAFDALIEKNRGSADKKNAAD